MENFGEINLSTIVGSLALLSLPLFRATFLPGSLSPLLGMGADLGCSCSEAALGWAGRCSSLRAEGLGSHCDVIQELRSYRMISEALGTQLAEITDRVLSHWLPTSQSEAEQWARRGRE